MNVRQIWVLTLVAAFGCDAELIVGADTGLRDQGADIHQDAKLTDTMIKKTDVAPNVDVRDTQASDLVARDLGNDVETDAEMESATRYLSWNNGDGVRVVSPNGDSLDGYIRGGDFDTPIWAADDIWSWYMLHITEGGSPTEDFARVTTPSVTDRNGDPAKVLKMALLKDAPNTTVEQIEFLEQQSAGKAGEQDSNFPEHTLVEPVFYQRQWIKFSPDTLARAQGVGARDFYQIFWEMKAEPDYRLRVQLNYDDTDGLVVRAHDDVLTNADPRFVDSGKVKVDIEMFEDDQSGGWYLFELWIDRTLGDASRWRVRFNGVDVLNYTGRLQGDLGNIMGVAMMLQIYSDVSDLSTSPFYQMIDDIEIWNQPPRDAFK